MKKSLSIIVFNVFCLCLMAQQKNICLDGMTIINGNDENAPLRNVDQRQDEILVTYKFNNAILQNDPIYPNSTIVKIKGFGLNSSVGEPATPFRKDSYMVPTEKCKVEIVDSEFVDTSLVLSPARPLLLNSTYDGFSQTNVPEIRSFKNWYPKEILSNIEVSPYQDKSILSVFIHPVQYCIQSNTVRFYKKITYKISFAPQKEDTNGTTRKSLPKMDNPVISNTILCSSPISRESSFVQTEGYAILSIPNYEAAVSKFADWKRTLGFNVNVLYSENWTPSLIKSKLRELYDSVNTNLQYILIIGDHQDVPAERKTAHVTDYYYRFKYNRTTGIPDFMCGRLPVSTPHEANVVVDKIIGYEKTPPSDDTFYQTGLNCAYFQDERVYWDPYDTQIDSVENRRFILTSEEIRDAMMRKGFNVNRVYSALAVSSPKYWNNDIYSFGGEIPLELQRPFMSWDQNYNQIKEHVDQGTLFVMHEDHGAIRRWGDPALPINAIYNWNNGNKLPVMFDVGCETGEFNDTTCMAEAFLRKENGGCVAVFAPTYDGYSGSSDALMEGMFDAIWPDSLLVHKFRDSTYCYTNPPTPTYRLGQILQQGLLRMEETYMAHLQLTKERFHCFGDPSMRIYSTIPTPFSAASVTRSNGSISVFVGEPATISFYNRYTGDVVNYYGSSVSHDEESENIVICISAPNKIPFIDDVVYLQNETICQNREYRAKTIKVGKEVTSSEPIGELTILSGKTILKAKSTELSSGTKIELGGELEIVSE